MTREKEIYLLKALLTMCDFKDAFGNSVPQSAYVEAVNAAIEALEFRDTYDQFWEEVKAAGERGKEIGIRYSGRLFKIREVEQDD